MMPLYRAFHRFGKAKFPNGGLVLGSNQFSILPQLPPKIMLYSKVVKIDPKIITNVSNFAQIKALRSILIVLL